METKSVFDMVYPRFAWMDSNKKPFVCDILPSQNPLARESSDSCCRQTFFQSLSRTDRRFRGNHASVSAEKVVDDDMSALIFALKTVCRCGCMMIIIRFWIQNVYKIMCFRMTRFIKFDIRSMSKIGYGFDVFR